MVVPIVNCHLICPQEAENVIDVGETKGLNHLGFPLPSPDHGFESDQSTLSTASLMSSRSERSDGFLCPQRGRQH